VGIRSLALSFDRTMRAEGRSPHTIKLYRDCLARLIRFIEAETGSDDLSAMTRRRLTDLYALRAATAAPSTVSIDFRVHRVFFRWCVDEAEISSSRMERMRQPRRGPPRGRWAAVAGPRRGHSRGCIGAGRHLARRRGTGTLGAGRGTAKRIDPWPHGKAPRGP
jgi:hypothetical protein